MAAVKPKETGLKQPTIYVIKPGVLRWLTHCKPLSFYLKKIDEVFNQL